MLLGNYQLKSQLVFPEHGGTHVVVAGIKGAHFLLHNVGEPARAANSSVFRGIVYQPQARV